MKAYGSKRTFGDCRTSRFRTGGKIHVSQEIKSKKFGRLRGKHEIAQGIVE